MSDTPITPAVISAEAVLAAEHLIGLALTAAERAQMLDSLNKRLPAYEQLRQLDLPNAVAPALAFSPQRSAVAQTLTYSQRAASLSSPQTMPTRPASLEEVAFWPVTALSQLISTRQVSALELTQMYLARLKRHNPALECVVTLTEELALQQAQRADDELARGETRGPLHGIPWGAKDLLAVQGYPTTWGAEPYQDQHFAENATVVERLEAAGAVLVAKLSMGALAYGDVWHGGFTRNPWNLEQGSSGSSAGSASAVAAGLVGFAIGTETMGSIISPAARCGITGLRPTFGRVSRHGAMALCWSMDKIGPMTRSVEDCALIFAAIHGPDGKEPGVVDRPFAWPAPAELRGLRIGYVKSIFDHEREHKAHDDATLAVMRDLGAELIALELPDYPQDALWLILWAEAAAAFDELTLSNRDDLLKRQDNEAWPNIFRAARFIPAVEYIQANRARTVAMQAMERVMETVDVYLQPNVWGKELALTNWTGHPVVVLPNGFSADGLPSTSMIFTGKLDGEAATLAVAKAYQQATDFHLRRPPLFNREYTEFSN